MAIDPSISLGLKPPVQADVAGSALKGLQLQTATLQPQLVQQQIAASQAEMSNTQAQNPGIVADAATKVRSLAAQQFIGMHMNDWVQKDPDGNAILDAGGQPKLNYAKAVSDMSANGYSDFAPAMAKGFSDTATNLITQSKTGQELADSVQKTSQQAVSIAAQLVKNAPDAATAMKQYNANIQHLSDIYGENSPIVTGIVNQVGENPSYASLQKWAIPAATSTMTPLEQENLKVSQGNLALNAQQVQNQTTQLKMTGNDQLLAAQDKIKTAGMFQNGSDSVDAWAPTTKIPTGAENWSNARWQEYVAANPAVQPTYQALVAHNAATGDKLTLATSPIAIKNALSVDAKNQNQQANIHAQSAKLTGQAAPQPTAPQPIQGGTPLGTVSIKRLSDGKVLTMPAADAQARLASKLYAPAQ